MSEGKKDSAPPLCSSSTQASRSGKDRSVPCRICQQVIHFAPGTSRVVQCSVCDEATPVAAAPPGKKYVRCPCNCLLTCSTSATRVICPRESCKRVIGLRGNTKEPTNPDDLSTQKELTTHLVGPSEVTWTSTAKDTTDHLREGDKDAIPEVAMLKSKLSVVQEEMEHLKQKHQQTLAKQDRQQQEIHQLTAENTRLKQQLSQEESKQMDASSHLQHKCSELEQANKDLEHLHETALQILKSNQGELEASMVLQQQLRQQLQMKEEENSIVLRQLQEAMEEIRKLQERSTSAEIDT